MGLYQPSDAIPPIRLTRRYGEVCTVRSLSPLRRTATVSASEDTAPTAASRPSNPVLLYLCVGEVEQVADQGQGVIKHSGPLSFGRTERKSFKEEGLRATVYREGMGDLVPECVSRTKHPVALLAVALHRRASRFDRLSVDRAKGQFRSGRELREHRDVFFDRTYAL